SVWVRAFFAYGISRSMGQLVSVANLARVRAHAQGRGSVGGSAEIPDDLKPLIPRSGGAPTSIWRFLPLRLTGPGHRSRTARGRVAQRIMEAVFGAMGKAIPERLFGAPAG